MPEVPEFDPDAVARILRYFTDRRNFAGDADRLTKAYQEEVGKVIEELSDHSKKLKQGLAPHYYLQLETKTTFGVFLRKTLSDDVIAECYIDTSEPPWLTLQFRGEKVGAEDERLVLAPGLLLLSEFAWHAKEDKQLTNSLVAEYCFENLFSVAITAVRKSTTLDPVRELDGV